MNRGDRRRGFTLLESLFSLLLVALLTMFVYNLLPTSFLATRQAGRETQADAVAASLIEEYRSKPFSDLAVATIKPAAVESGGIKYLPTVRISQPTGKGGDRLRHVEVEVSWQFQNQFRQVRYALDVVDIPR